MQTSVNFSDPDKIEVSIAIKMTIREWREFQHQLAAKWPSSRLSQQITDVLWKATRTIYGETAEAETVAQSIEEAEWKAEARGSEQLIESLTKSAYARSGTP